MIAIFLLEVYMLIKPEEEYEDVLKNYEYRTELNKSTIFERVTWSSLNSWRKHKTYYINFIRLLGILFILFSILISRAA